MFVIILNFIFSTSLPFSMEMNLTPMFQCGLTKILPFCTIISTVGAFLVHSANKYIAFKQYKELDRQLNELEKG